MIVRSILVTALLFAAPSAASAQEKDDAIAPPVLHAQVTVESDVVRIGDMIDNAGTAAQIAIYRSPDLGTTGTLPTAQIINALQGRVRGTCFTVDLEAVRTLFEEIPWVRRAELRRGEILELALKCAHGCAGGGDEYDRII